MPAFVTVADLDALDAFGRAAPDDAPATRAAYEAFIAARNFLWDRTELVVDASADALGVDAFGMARHPLLFKLASGRPADAPLRFRPNASTPSAPWTMRLSDAPPTDATLLHTSSRTLADAHARLREGRRVALRKGKPFPDELGRLAPSDGLILIDPYALQGGKAGLSSVCHLLRPFVPAGAARFAVLVVAGGEWRKMFTSVQKAHEAVETALHTAFPHLDLRLALALTPEASAYHDRHLFTRYGKVLAGRSSDTLFNDAGTVQKATDLDGRFVIDAAQRGEIAQDVQHVYALVQKAITAAPILQDRGAFGDFAHPLFALLDEA